MTANTPVGRFKSRLRSLNGDGGYGLTLLVLCVLLLAPEMAGDAAREVLRYDRVAIAAGEGWRLLTGHFVHLNLEHAALNIAGFVLLWTLFARDYRPSQWTSIVLAAIAAIDAGLWFGDRELIWYVGASGLLHGVMAAGTLAHMRRREFDGWILTVFLIGKLIYEQTHGAMPFSSGLGPVVVDAHLYGAIGGLSAAIIARFLASGES